MADSFVSSGTVTGQTVSSGNTMYVLSSGSADFTNIVAGGTQTVYDGGIVSGSGVNSGATLFVSAGGKASGADVIGSLIVSGGAVYKSYVGAGGSALVESGGLYATTIGLDGFVQLKAHASGVVLNGGGFEDIYGGVQSGTTVYNSGALEIDSGMDSGALIEAGGQIDDAFGGKEYNAIVMSGGYLHINAGGLAEGIVVGSGGTEAVTEGGTVGGTVLNGGTLIVAGGGDASGAVVNQGGSVISKGIAIYQGTSSTVVEAPTFTGLIVAGYPENAYVLSGGVVHGLRLYDDARAFIGADGTADDSVVSGGAVFNVAYDSNVSGTTLVGGTELNSGATVYATKVGSGGTDILYDGTTSGEVLNAGGVQVVYGGVVIDAAVNSGGEQYVDGLFASAVTSNTNILSGGFEFVVNGGYASNTTIDGGILDLAVSSGSSLGGFVLGHIDFSGSGGQLYAGAESFDDFVISGFAQGDTIDVSDHSYISGDFVFVSEPGVVTLGLDHTTYVLNVAGATSHTDFKLLPGYDGEGVALIEFPPCFAAGTHVLTPRGEVAVERLAVGDSVITHTGADAGVIWIGRRRIDLLRHPRPGRVRPIRIAASAFAEGVPSRDLLLSPDHALFFEGVLIPAKALINQRNICQIARPFVFYYHIELAHHSIIFAEHCAVETYLETGNRGTFENGAGAITLHPDFAQTLRERQSCAPLIEQGPQVDAARERTLRRYYEERRDKLG